MGYEGDSRLDRAKAFDWAHLIDLLGISNLKFAAPEYCGPCPECGGRDRFSINTRKGVFNCRRCQKAGDQVALVQMVRSCDFRVALEFLCGPEQALSREELTAIATRQAENKRRNAAIAEKHRAAQISAASRIWREGRAAEASMVRDYLGRRGLTKALLPQMPSALRYHPDLPFMVMIDRDWVQVHRGPAMLAAVRGPDGRFSAVHRTYLDMGQAKGKALITHPVSREALPSKKVLGSKKGGAIRFIGGEESGVLIMAEGIETTLSALVADAVPGAGYWAGVDLGNMSGRRQSGKGLKFAGLPDMSDADAFVPPAWVRRLIYVQDGDSDPQDTRAKLLSGLRRAKLLRPGLVAQIVHAGAGLDLNDVLQGDADE